MQSHHAPYPSAAKSPRTVPMPRTRRALTFSTMTMSGRSSPTSRAYSRQRPLRSPARPPPFPARLMSWQGNPPQMTSTSPTSAPLRARTSSKRGTLGQWWASKYRQTASISQNATGSNPPVRSRPRLNPPIPENRSSVRSMSCHPRKRHRPLWRRKVPERREHEFAREFGLLAPPDLGDVVEFSHLRLGQGEGQVLCAALGDAPAGEGAHQGRPCTSAHTPSTINQPAIAQRANI